MTEPTKPMNLLQRLNAVRKKVEYIKKDKDVPTGGSKTYKAVTHDMVTAMTRAHLIEYGVIFFPSLVASTMSPPRNAESKLWLYEATYDFEFCNIDDRTDTKTVRIEAHANDNADKAPGKALSYAAKYAILKVLNIETGEDEESRRPEETDIEPHLVQIGGCQTLDELKQVFGESFKMLSSDKEATKALIKAKDNKKAELTRAAS